jgi:HEAT repeat protein
MDARRLLVDRTADEKARIGAAVALAEAPDPDALPVLLRILGDESEDTALRLAVVGALEALGDPAAVPALLAVLARDERDYQLDEPVAWALPGFGPAAVPALLAALDPAPWATHQVFFVLDALGRLGDPRAVAPLRVILADPARATDHAAALDALHALGAAPPVAELAALARDVARDQTLRISAIGALVYPCIPGAVAVLLTLLDAPARAVARAAINGLGVCRDTAAVAPLLAHFGDPDGGTRLAIALALGRLGDARALPVLRMAAEHDPFTFMGLSMADTARRALAMITQERPPGDIRACRGDAERATE